jgi:hypothetical protein
MATAYAVPFLTALAADRDVPTRSDILLSLLTILRSSFDGRVSLGARVREAFGLSERWLAEARVIGPTPFELPLDLMGRMLHGGAKLSATLAADVDEAIEALEHSVS